MKLLLVYLVGRQVLVARCTDANQHIDQVGPDMIPSRLLCDQPFELAIVPHPQTREPVPTLLPYGSNGGVLPAIKSQTFDRHHILHLNEVPAGLEEAYIKASSGLVLAR